MVAAARMPATKIEAYEDDTKFHFHVESDFPRFLDSVLQRTDQISQMKVDEEIVEQHIVVVDQTVRLLRIPRYTPRQQFTAPHGSGALCHLYKPLFP